MGYVQKYDIKIRDRNEVRLKIEEHLEDVFTTLDMQCYLSDFQTFHDNVKYASDVVSFLANVGIMSERDKKKYGKKLIDIQKERLYSL